MKLLSQVIADSLLVFTLLFKFSFENLLDQLVESGILLTESLDRELFGLTELAIEELLIILFLLEI